MQTISSNRFVPPTLSQVPMGEIVPYKNPHDEDLYERAASHWLDFLEEMGRQPTLQQVFERMQAAHPEVYPADDVSYVLGKLRRKDFRSYLAERRTEHLREQTAAKLLAAELGARVGVKAMERIQRLLEEDELKPKELVDIAKLGFELNSRVDIPDKQESQAIPTGNNTFNNVLLGVDPDRAMAMMQELMRRKRIEAQEE